MMNQQKGHQPVSRGPDIGIDSPPGPEQVTGNRPTPDCKFTQLQADIYAKTPGCPSCGCSDDKIERDEPEYQCQRVVVGCECSVCEEVWIEAYRIYGIGEFRPDLDGCVVRTFEPPDPMCATEQECGKITERVFVGLGSKNQIRAFISDDTGDERATLDTLKDWLDSGRSIRLWPREQADAQLANQQSDYRRRLNAMENG